jgi:hypothetical protein
MAIFIHGSGLWWRTCAREVPATTSAGRYGVSRPAGTISFALMIIVHMARSDSAVARDSFWWPTTRGSISVIQHFLKRRKLKSIKL